MKRDFVKLKDEDLAAQLSRFYSELVKVGSLLGFSQAEIEEAGRDAAAFSFYDAAHTKIGAYYKTVTAFKNDIKAGIGGPVQEFPVLDFDGLTPVNVPDGIVTRFRAKAAKAKSSSNYTNAIGLQLGIEGIEVPDEDPTSAKPTIGGLRITASKVELKWKKGQYDGIRIFRKIDGGQFELTGFSVSPPYIDSTPLPTDSQVWTYQIQYFIDDNEVGLKSDPSSISVSASQS